MSAHCALVKDQYELLNQLVFPALAAQGIQFVNARTVTPGNTRLDRRVLRYRSRTRPDAAGARSGPTVSTHSEQESEFHRAPIGQGRIRSRCRARSRAGAPLLAANHSPAATDEAPGITYFVFLSAVISTFVAQLFSGMTVEGAWQFRVTRNSDLFVDDEEVDNLLRAIEGELAQRRYGAAVRLETSLDCPEDITNFSAAPFRADARRSVSGQWSR